MNETSSCAWIHNISIRIEKEIQNAHHCGKMWKGRSPSAFSLASTAVIAARLTQILTVALVREAKATKYLVTWKTPSYKSNMKNRWQKTTKQLPKLMDFFLAKVATQWGPKWPKIKTYSRLKAVSASHRSSKPPKPHSHVIVLGCSRVGAAQTNMWSGSSLF